MQFTLRPDGVLERVALWLNLGPTPIAQAFFGMMSSRAAMAGVRLGLFARLAQGPATADVIAGDQQLSAPGTRLLLEALAMLELVKVKGAQYALAPRARRWLDPSSRQYIGDFLEFNYAQWEWWSNLEEAIRTGKGPEIHAFADDDPRWKSYVLAMFQLARLAAPEVTRAITLPRGAQRLLDLGGAHGWFAAELCRRTPGLQATVLDLPGSARAGRELLAREGGADRVQHVEGDLKTSSFGAELDGVLCFQVLHHLSEENSKTLLRKIATALKPGGTLAILEFFADPAHHRLDAGALVGLHYFLTSSAAAYPRSTVEGWLREAGFEVGRATRIRRIPNQTLLVATRR